MKTFLIYDDVREFNSRIQVTSWRASLGTKQWLRFNETAASCSHIRKWGEDSLEIRIRERGRTRRLQLTTYKTYSLKERNKRVAK